MCKNVSVLTRVLVLHKHARTYTRPRYKHCFCERAMDVCKLEVVLW